MPRLAHVLLAMWLTVGCGEGDIQRADARFSTPEHTVDTLLTTYGLNDMPQEAIQRQIVQRGAFELRDEATWRLCFADLDQPGGEGLAGYVLGLLAAGRDDLRFETTHEGGAAIVRDGIRIVFAHGSDGAYRIVLRESVPEDVRRGLLMVEENHRESIRE
ncbi:MAG: hypothetical protein AB7S26_26380 [Sandaracinaceae bacterium]